MGMASIFAGRAFIELTTKDSKFQKGLQEASAKLKAFGNKASEAGKSMAAFWAPIAAPAAMAVKVFADFDDQMRLCQAVTQASGKDFDLLAEKAKKLGRETSFTASQVASGMVALGRMGFKPKEIDNAIASVMDLSRVTGTDLAQAADIAANSMRMFGLNSSKMTSVVDILSVTANSSAQTLGDLFEGLKQAAPAAAGANENIKDVCTNLGILANMGIKGSMAGNALKKAYLQMADPKIQQYLDDTFGIRVLDGNKNLRRMADILTDVAKAINGMPTAEKLAFLQDVFDIRGMTGAQGIIANIDQIEAFRKKLDQSSGSAAKSAKAMDEGIGGTLRILASQIEGVAIALGQALVPFLKGAAAAFSPVITVITEFITKNGALLASITQIAMRNVVFGAGLFAIGKIISYVSGVISIFSNGLIMCGNIVKGFQAGIGFLSDMFRRCVSGIRDYGAALSLAREAMAASGGRLTAAAFRGIAEAAGIAVNSINRYVMAILASGNVEVGRKTLEWLKGLPGLFTDLCRRIYIYITTIGTASASNGIFAVSCQTVGNAMKGAWKAITSAVTGLVKYVATVGLAGAATAALGGIVKVLTVTVAGLGKALTFLAAHPVVLVLTVALVAIAATVATIAARCNAESKQAKKDAEEARAAYERAQKNTETGQQKRRQGFGNMEALQKLAEASKTSKLSAEEIETAVALINSLKPFGSEGWASIDKTTGRIKLAEDAIKQFQQTAQRQAVMEAEAELKALKAQEAAVKKQMAKYGGWRDKFNLGWDTSAEYNEAYEKELDAIRAKQLAAHARLNQAKKGSDEGVYGQQMRQTAADKADQAARRREVSLKSFQDAERAAAEYEKKLSDSRKSALEREIDQIDAAKKKYMEMLKVMLQYESQKQADKQDQGKIAEWQKKLANAEAEADRLKQEARDRESKKASDDMKQEQKSFAETQKRIQDKRNEDAAQKKIDETVKNDPKAGMKMLSGLLVQAQAAARQAAMEFQEALKDAAKPDSDGVVRYTDEERAKIQAAKAKYEQNESRVDNYRSQLRRLQEEQRNSPTVTGIFGGGDVDSLSLTQRPVEEINTKLSMVDQHLTQIRDKKTGLLFT